MGSCPIVCNCLRGSSSFKGLPMGVGHVLSKSPLKLLGNWWNSLSTEAAIQSQLCPSRYGALGFCLCITLF